MFMSPGEKVAMGTLIGLGIANAGLNLYADRTATKSFKNQNVGGVVMTVIATTVSIINTAIIINEVKQSK